MDKLITSLDDLIWDDELNYIEKAPALAIKTKQFQDLYMERLRLLHGYATPGQKDGIFREVLALEKAHLAAMDALSGEYDEIMQAQDIFNKLNEGKS